MRDLASFSLSDMAEFSAALRAIGAGAESLEEVARRIVRHLHEQFIDPETGGRACSMVRFYKTHPFGDLDDDLREFARRRLGGVPGSPTMQCLVLMASAGERPEWNSRKSSVNHRAIPLPSEKIVASSPMISQLIRQLGLELSAVLEPDPDILLDLAQRTYNVFHVPEALGSPYVPAQEDFVIPFKIRSVLGFGGMLPSAELFAVILFSKVFIPRQTADLFRTLALSVKVALLPFGGGRIFQ